jgi:hypothetical protein
VPQVPPHGGLCICAVVVAELGRYFSDALDLRDFLAACPIDHDPLSLDAALEAARNNARRKLGNQALARLSEDVRFFLPVFAAGAYSVGRLLRYAFAILS